MGAEGFFAEPEFLGRDGVADVRRFHILAHFCNGDVEVEVEGKYGARDEDNENAERCVLKVSDLNLHRPELDTPTHVGVGGRWLKAHVLPIGRLQILKMVGLGKIERLEIFREDHDGITDEEMSEMGCEKIVHAAVYKTLFDVLVDY
jgi:hypothetical protein